MILVQIYIKNILNPEDRIWTPFRNYKFQTGLKVILLTGFREA
uniref:Uncharacterized protein n=1 Tax=Arundo donax TaxID=35708 RepID=A0A0A9BAN8_ARUDO